MTEYWLAGKVSPVSSEAGGWRARYPAYLNNEGQQQSPPKKELILNDFDSDLQNQKSKKRYPAYLNSEGQQQSPPKKELISNDFDSDL